VLHVVLTEDKVEDCQNQVQRRHGWPLACHTCANSRKRKDTDLMEEPAPDPHPEEGVRMGSISPQRAGGLETRDNTCLIAM